MVETKVAAREVSATGGSARTQAHDLRARTWRPRPFLGFAIGAIALVLPCAVAVGVVHVAARLVRRPHGAAALTLWLVGLGVVAGVTLWTVHRAAKRLLPIAAMLRFSLVFPDSAPSRFAVALRTGSGRALERALQQGTTTTADFSTSRDSASLVVDLIAAVSAHDRLTRGHSERVRAYADLIGEELGLDPEDRNKLHWAALLHDVGKLAVPAAILNKPERLTAGEWEIVREHPAMSARWLEPVRDWLGDWALAASQHHERYDGLGYPDGLKGEDISLAGRIVAVADAFDVMTSTRSYKKPLPAAQARTELTNNAGTQFDPSIVRAFLAVSLGKLRFVVGPLAGLSALSGLVSLGGTASAAAAAAVATTAVAASALTVAPPATHASVRTTHATTTTSARTATPSPSAPALGSHYVPFAGLDRTAAVTTSTTIPPSTNHHQTTCSAPPVARSLHGRQTPKSRRSPKVSAPGSGEPCAPPRDTASQPSPPGAAQHQRGPATPKSSKKLHGPGPHGTEPTPRAKKAKQAGAPSGPKATKPFKGGKGSAPAKPGHKIRKP